MIDAAVIGGGISGLSTAYALVRRGFKVQVLERQTSCGGAAVSEKLGGGFLMEHGPSSISASVDGVEDFSQRLGLDDHKCGLKPDVRYRYLVKNGNLCPISTHPLGFFTAPYLSPSAKANMLFEVFRARGDASNESVAQFCNRRFGREFTASVIDPLVAGLYGARAGDISLAATFPALADMEEKYGSLTLAVIARKMAGGRMPAKRLFSWKEGVASLPSALAGQLGSHIKTGVAVRRIVPVPGGFAIDTGKDGKLNARSVILATQPHATAALAEDVDAHAAGVLFDIPAPPISVIYLGYAKTQIEHKLDGIGYLTPEAEGRTASGALFPSTMFEGRAPEGHVALSVYIGGSRAPEAAGRSPDDLVAMARDELRDMLGARGEPVVARVRQWARGLPQLATGHGRRLDVLEGAEAGHPGLFFTGNYFSGPGIARCISNAAGVAAKATAYLEDHEGFTVSATRIHTQ